VANSVFAQTTHVVGSKSDFAWGSLRDSPEVQVSSNLVKCFLRCSCRNLPFYITLAVGLYNSMYYCTSCDNLLLQWIINVWKVRAFIL